MKVLKPAADPAENSERRALFKKEVEILQANRHPNVPEVLDFFEATGTLYLVEELIPGVTLEEKLLKEGRLDASTVGPIAKQLQDAPQMLAAWRAAARQSP